MLHRAAPSERVLLVSFSRAQLTLDSVDLHWAGGAQVLAVGFAGRSETALEEVPVQEVHLAGLLIKHIPVHVKKAGNHHHHLPPELPNL